MDRIEAHGDSGKCGAVAASQVEQPLGPVIFSEPAKAIGPIKFGDAPSGAMQGPRYTSFERLKLARTLTDVIGASRA